MKVRPRLCKFCGVKGDFRYNGTHRMCYECYMIWRDNGKARCRLCKTTVLDLKKHFREKDDAKHLILEVMTS